MPNENKSIGTWHIPIGTNLIFSISLIALEGWSDRNGRSTNRFVPTSAR